MNLKIWHKMIVGISIPSLLVVFGGLLSYQYLNDVKDRQGFVQIADNLKEETLEVRRNEKNFLLHKNAEYYNYCRDAIYILNNSVSHVSGEIVEDIGKHDFLQLGSSIRKYSGLMDALLKNYDEENEVIESVREEGRKLETYITQKDHAAELSTDFILNLRRLEKNYMLFRDKNSFDMLDNALSQLKNTTPFCLKCTQYINAVHGLFSSYKKSEELVNELQIAGNKLEDITNRIADREREVVRSFITLTQRHLLVAVLLLCILGPYFVYKTAKMIVAPIKRLDDITNKISEGDISLRAPIREHDETYSLALSFNRMLDNLQLTQQSLERSMELLQEKQSQLVESKKLASIGTLASGVAHELNNPLNNIYTTAQRLIKKSGDECAPYVKKGLDDIFGQTMRVKKIVGDLLEFARGREPQLREVELNGLILNAYRQLGNNGRIDNVKFTFDSASDRIMTLADPEQLEQVFINLFANAIDAMPDQGILKVNTEPEGSVVKIKVSDTGGGMSRETIDKMFEPFFTTKDRGTGLGLAIVFNIIQKHNGEIIAESSEGQGTTFFITLPVENS
ncbi:MAG: sensor histidine kinase [Nitrospiraceae bacterium]|nr:MAG: sensor histidine kinase [Nitrospiraceae bacterium]